MAKIEGKDLLKLGFTKELSTPLTAMESEYHYYTYDVSGKTLLISCSNDEKVDGGYEVEFYDIQGLKFRDLSQLKKLVKLLMSATK